MKGEFKAMEFTENHNTDKTQIILEQYKLYMEMLDRSTKRRMDTNALFISIHTVMVTIVSLFNRGNPWALLAVAAAGIAFSILWRALLIHYNTINRVKWDVLYDMEQFLPYKPFYAEYYEKLKRTDKKTWRSGNNIPAEENPQAYYAISRQEKALPWFFGFLYAIIGIVAVYMIAKGGANANLAAAIAEVNEAIAKVNDTLAKVGASAIG